MAITNNHVARWHQDETVVEESTLVSDRWMMKNEDVSFDVKMEHLDIERRKRSFLKDAKVDTTRCPPVSLCDAINLWTECHVLPGCTGTGSTRDGGAEQAPDQSQKTCECSTPPPRITFVCWRTC